MTHEIIIILLLNDGVRCDCYWPNDSQVEDREIHLTKRAPGHLATGLVDPDGVGEYLVSRWVWERTGRPYRIRAPL